MIKILITLLGDAAYAIGAIACSLVTAWLLSFCIY